MFNESLLKNEELAVFKLRQLYSKYGYNQYKMSKFEEYDMYVRNKDFLISDRVITFNDTNGKLLALKPDVTLSIINHLDDSPQQIQKLYYNENVYRVSNESHRFKEIMQTGLECVGDIGVYEVCEVTSLAIKSLKLIDENFCLEISHAGFVAQVIKEYDIPEDIVAQVQNSISFKNEGAVLSLKNEGKLNADQANIICALIKNYTDIASVETAITVNSASAKNALNEFLTVCNTLKQLQLFDKVIINFSLANNMAYYSGIVFKGYIEGIPTGVLSGGQYDILMKKLKKNASAIGFAVYLDSFERLNKCANEYDVDILLIADKATSPVEILKAVEAYSQNGNSVLVRSTIPPRLKYKKAFDISGKEIANA